MAHDTRLHFMHILQRTDHYISFYFISYNLTFTTYLAAESNNSQQANAVCISRIRRRRQWMFLTIQQNVNSGTERERNSDKTVILPEPLIIWFNITGTITRSIPLRLRLFHALGLNCCNMFYSCQRTVQSILRNGAILTPGLTAA